MRNEDLTIYQVFLTKIVDRIQSLYPARENLFIISEQPNLSLFYNSQESCAHQQFQG